MSQPCQIFKVNGSLCDKPASGVLVPDGMTPLEWYKEGQVLCYKDGKALEAVTGGTWVMLAEIQHALAELAPREDSPPAPSVNLTADRAAVLPNVAPPAAPEQEPEQEQEQEKEQEQKPAAAPGVPCPTAIKLREEAAALLAMAATDKSIEKLLKQAAAVKYAEADKAQAAADKAQAEADKGTPEQQWIRLLTAIAAGGAGAVDAFKAAVQDGAIIRKVCKNTPKAETSKTPAAATSTAPKGHTGRFSDDIIQKARDMKAAGKTGAEITAALDLEDDENKTAFYLYKRAKLSTEKAA